MCLLAAALPAHGKTEKSPHQDTYQLIAERLEMMQEIAAWKRANETPVEDRAREKIVLDTARSDAQELGLDSTSVMPFVQEQMNAAKEVQRCWTKRWDEADEKAATAVKSEWADPEEKPRGLAPEMPLDHLEQVRPRLLTINAMLMTTIKATLSAGADYGDAEDLMAFDRTIAIDCLSRARRNGIYKALTLIELAK